MTAVFESVIVANRGEIAVRILATLRRMGIRTIAVYSDADSDALHVRAADAAVRLGPAPAAESYLSVERLLAAARSEGAEALHPGYGFLSENPELARACEAAGIVFIGPSPAVIADMGDKAAAKRIAVGAGVPIVPGVDGSDIADAELAARAREIGLPVLIKPAAGGGGKGMRIAEEGDDIPALIVSARREAEKAFGDGRLILERLIERPRHIEVQVVGDRHGTVIHLGDRECSLQRRHQKVIEEAPAPRLDPAIRARMADAAVALARRVGYVGVGTVEFVVPAEQPGDFAFLEMNTRLQVEHPVTEAVTGIDLVEWQVRVAAGEPLPRAQSDIVLTGHAMEARVYAEDPRRGFLPATGTVLAWDPDPVLRWDAAVEVGAVVSTEYDPLLAKAISWGSDRAEARDILEAGLGRTILLGVASNIDALRAILADPSVVAGHLDTGLLGRILAEQAGEAATLGADPGPEVADIAAGCFLASLASPDRQGVPAGAGASGWSARDGWTLLGGRPIVVDVVAAVPDAVAREVRVAGAEHGGRSDVSCAWDDGGRLWLHAPSLGTHAVRVAPPRDRVLPRPGRSPDAGGAGGTRAWTVRSPLPGAIVDVPVAVGDEVAEGDVVAIVEAMKMEHAVRAPAAGIVATVHVEAGEQVRLDADLVTASPDASGGESGEGSGA